MKKTTHLLMVAMIIFASVSTAAFAALDLNDDLNVTSIDATPYNAAVTVSWEAVTTDDLEIEAYEVHYGTVPESENESGIYESMINVGNVTEYTITGLQNDSTYYFSIVANSTDGQTSGGWSTELSATPSSELASPSLDDGEAPTIKSAEAIYNNTVKVVLSEPINLLEDNPEVAFQITDSIENLYITGAEFDPEDKTDSTVLLTTDEQVKDLEYTLTIGTDIVDKYGNNVVSGTSDTAIFIGTSLEKPEGDVTQPMVTDAKSTGPTTILVNFDETVSLSVDPTKDFIITGLDNEEEVLTVTKVTLGNNEEGVEYASAIITTSEQKDISYTIKFENIKDLSDNVVSEQSRIFTGTKTEETIVTPDTPGTDTSAPKDIAKLIAKTTVELTKFNVKLSWTLPLETEDLVKQSIYMSKGSKDDFTLKTTLDAEKESYEVEGLTAGEYYFKHTQTDMDGNESDGVITKVLLSETGPGMAGLLLLSLGAGQLSRRKKRK